MEEKVCKIVLVDDNLTSLATGKALLKNLYEVYPSPSAAKLFELLENIRPDLILLDIEMPEMDGFEVIKKLKANPDTADIPVIFLTARLDDSSEQEGFDLGAVDYINKPFSGPLLIKRIANQLLIAELRKKLNTILANQQDSAENTALKN